MSLQIWLPLNGNLTQQGLTSTAITNCGATVNNNGKIGKCYSFNGTGDYMYTNYGLPKTVGSWSFCCWAKLNNNSNTMCLYSQRTTVVSDQRCIFLVSGKVIYFDDGSRIINTLDTSATLTNWTHYAFVRDASKLYVYINGELALNTSITTTPSTVGSYTMFGSSQYSDTGASGNFLNGYMNDIRVYDEALPPKIIKELSRGMVLHYPLNGNGRNGENLLKNTGSLTAWTKESGITTTWDSDKQMYKIVDSSHTSSRWGIYQDLNIEANTTYTLTCTLEGVSCGVGLGFYDSTMNYPPAAISSMGTKITQSYTATSGASSTRARVYLFTNPGTSAEAWFSLPKLEKGSTATPWMPNSADSAYTSMGYNSTTEYDVSGYKYNGIKTGTFAYDVDTARYSVSTKFNGTNTYIEADPLPAETKTISVWLKTSWAYPPSGYRLAVHDKNTGLAIGWTTGLLIANCGTTNGSTCAPTGKYIANQWNHVVIVKTGATTRDIYVNGEKMTTAVNNYWGADQNTLNIGNRHYSGTYAAYWDGQMSDFRAYATALSADDILELYNTVASVANNGTLLTRGEIVEQ